MGDSEPRILLVDDIRENLNLMRAVFEAEGFQVSEADNGRAALAQVAADPPEVALIDLKMPGMNGIEILRELRASAPEVQVIMITAYAEVSSAVEAMKLGAEDFLIRPIHRDRLALTVLRALERRHLKTQLEELDRWKLREQELTRVRDAALELARLKSEFLARMSHEIRTPLNAIVGFTEMLLYSALDLSTHSKVEIIQTNCQHLMRLVDDLLDFSKLEAGRAVLEETVFDLGHLFKEIAESFAPAVSAKGLVLQTAIDANLPKRVCGDPRRLRQVVDNLVSNAVKFTARGHVRINAVTVESGRHDLVIRFEVEDSGIGIATELQHSLFQPFVQADSSTTARYGGAGLGLAISARIVERMGGQIGVSSEAGRGATFYFTARFKKSRAHGTALPDENPGSAAADRSWGGRLQQHRGGAEPPLRVLVVDDNASSRALAVLQLNVLGFDAQAVEDGEQALAELTRADYAIILMDCEMPVRDGYETTIEIRRRESAGRHTVIIAMTAHAFQTVRDRSLAAGMDDYLSKPVTLEALSKMTKLWSARIKSGESLGTHDSASAGIKLNGKQLNDVYIDELRLMSGAAGIEVFSSLVDGFFSELPGWMAALSSAIDSQDLDLLRRTAQTLKGAANTVGAVGFAWLCGKLQESAERSDMDGACQRARNLIEEAAQLRGVLQAAVKARSEASPSSH